MQLLSKNEERMLRLLIEQDWENDKGAYIKFRKQADEELIAEYNSLVSSLIEKKYVAQKRVRYFLLTPEAYSYFRDKKIDKIKKLVNALTPWIIAAIGWGLAIIQWVFDKTEVIP
ncbi:hypothetical protein ACTQ33_16390 [Candidatus Avoscillospira sp. LCP25S3_F1]|uniref:hypothetical protein n=1 Tax=Candidatus Avoscillospira sp. LCP25S3_F1 TaxID=3438825 RepID=UPI003F93F69B